MIASFIKEKFGWIESDLCWWCGSGRQSREHLFKECLTWKKEIRELWKKVAEQSGVVRIRGGTLCKGRRGFFLGWVGEQERAIRRPGNTSVRDLMYDRRFIGAVLDFLRDGSGQG